MITKISYFLVNKSPIIYIVFNLSFSSRYQFGSNGEAFAFSNANFNISQQITPSVEITSDYVDSTTFECIKNVPPNVMEQFQTPMDTITDTSTIYTPGMNYQYFFLLLS